MLRLTLRVVGEQCPANRARERPPEETTPLGPHLAREGKADLSVSRGPCTHQPTRQRLGMLDRPGIEMGPTGTWALPFALGG